MTTTTAILLGAVLAAGLVAIARRLKDEKLIYAVGLITAAAIYVGFAAGGGTGLGAIGLELTGLLAFAAVARMGLRSSPIWLAGGWTAHVVWDVALHPGGPADYAPAWYVDGCIGFDLLLAGYIGWWLRRETPSAGWG